MRKNNSRSIHAHLRSVADTFLFTETNWNNGNNWLTNWNNNSMAIQSWLSLFSFVAVIILIILIRFQSSRVSLGNELE
jgi:hypothetical protein